jgi:copper chaperone CopZ
MYKIFITAVIFLGFVSSCHKTDRVETAQSKQMLVNFESVSIRVPSIKCDMCVNTIKDALKKNNGIENADVNLQGKIAMVRYDKSSTDLKKIEQAISNAGYDANEIPRNRQAYENLPACCK